MGAAEAAAIQPWLARGSRRKTADGRQGRQNVKACRPFSATTAYRTCQISADTRVVVMLNEMTPATGGTWTDDRSPRSVPNWQGYRPPPRWEAKDGGGRTRLRDEIGRWNGSVITEAAKVGAHTTERLRPPRDRVTWTIPSLHHAVDVPLRRIRTDTIWWTKSAGERAVVEADEVS